MKKVCFFLLFVFLTSAVSAKISFAEDEKLTDGREVHLRVKNQYVGDDSHIQWNMQLINKSGYIRRRVLLRYLKDYDGLKKVLVRFLDPPDIRKTGLLTWENAEADDTQFLYLPALKKTRRIATSDKDQSFVGTDFNYEDMGNIKVDDFTYSKATTETKGGYECYFYEAYAKPGANTVYSKMRTWVDKQSFIRVYVEYFDKRGKFFKIAVARDIEKIDGVWTPRYTSMENLEDKHKTVVNMTDIIYNSGMSNEIFTLVNLENASYESH